MTNAPQSLEACVAVLKRLQAEAKQRFGLLPGERPRDESYFRWPLRLRASGNNTLVHAELTLHREFGHAPMFVLRYGNRPDDVALKASIVWRRGGYVIEVEEPDQGRHKSLTRAVAQLKAVALRPAARQPASAAYESVHAAILI